MSTPNPTHIDIIAKAAGKVLWDADGTLNFRLNAAIAAHVVSKLTDAGYSIVPAADVKSVRLVAEYALHLRTNGERAPGGYEAWAKFDRFAESVLRATGPAAAAEGEKP